MGKIKPRKDSKRVERNGKTYWLCSGCSYNDFCYVHLLNDYQIDAKCDRFSHVDEGGVNCNYPNALDFILED